MDREQKRKQRVQLRCLKKLDKKEEKLLEERKPSLIAQKAGELTAPVREKLREKVPEKFSDGAQAAAEKSTELLEKAFEKSFEVVLEKGSRWIGKLCSEEKLREDYLQFAQKPLSGWELYKLGCKAAGRAGANMAFSSVQGTNGVRWASDCRMSPSFWERCSRRCLKFHCALGTHTTLNRNKFTRCC